MTNNFTSVYTAECVDKLNSGDSNVDATDQVFETCSLQVRPRSAPSWGVHGISIAI